MTLAFALIIAFWASDSTSARDSQMPALASANWSSENQQSLIGRPPSLAQVQALVNYLRGTDFTVCSFRFANLRNVGTLSLVTFVDEGNGFCNYIDIIDKEDASAFTLNEIEQSRTAGDDYGKAIQDLDSNGASELVVKIDFASYFPGNGYAYFLLWPVIYKWNGGGYVDASDHFRSYYQQLFKTMQHEFEGQAALPACLATAQEAKYKRFLGLDPAAGIKDAITCAGSNSPAERELALLLLSDIGTPEAVQHIQALSHDPNKGISSHARIILARLAMGSPLAAPKLVSIIILPTNPTNTRAVSPDRSLK